MLFSSDSWYAVASAIVAARAGSPRSTAIAAISAAFSACSGSSSTGAAADLGRALARRDERA